MRRYHHVYTCYRVSRRRGGGEQRFAPACPFVALSDLPQILQQRGSQQSGAHGVPPMQGARMRKFPIVASLTMVQQM
ncbi:Uncharacterized protein HZ326_8241 [Fusarium oxysporum f. sp. albedinis]|nr:Uncharacterized protein HZ326_8241 [Fusarium oxysporum f. sp. albedinis]